MTTKDKRGNGPVTRPQAVGKRSSGHRRLRRLTKAFLAEAGLTAPSEGQTGLARRCAGATIELEAMEEAQAAGQPLPRLEYTRISGTLRRHRKSLGLDEGASPLLNGDAAPGPSFDGVTSLPSLRDAMGLCQKPWPESLADYEWFLCVLKEACRVEACESGRYFGTERDPYPGAPTREESRRVAACIHKREDPFDGRPAPDWFPQHLHELFPKADWLEARVHYLEAGGRSMIVYPKPDIERPRDFAQRPRRHE